MSVKKKKQAVRKVKEHSRKPQTSHARTPGHTRELLPGNSSANTANGEGSGQTEQSENTETTTAVVTAGGLHDYTEYEPLVDTDLEYKVSRRQELSKLIEEAEKEKKRLTDDILAAMTASGMGDGGHKVLCHEHVVSTVQTRTPSTLSKTLLMENGVLPSLIEKCTVPGLQYVQVRVTKSK